MNLIDSSYHVEKILVEYFPEYDNERREAILWRFTPFPLFDVQSAYGMAEFHRSLAHYRDCVADGEEPCELCLAPMNTSKAICANCMKSWRNLVECKSEVKKELDNVII